MNKLYNRIIFVNGTTPALNETNLNAISKALDDLDDRVVELAGDLVLVIPQLEQDLSDASALTDRLEAMTENPPYIGLNGNWYIWDTNTGAYVDSGVDASITISVGTVTSLAPGSTPTVVNVGTATDPIFNFGIPQGATGTEGISPTVSISSITGGHAVTITDADHPGGQTFYVMDGAGDMDSSVYDPTNAVANAGGIVDYIDGVITAALTASY